MSVNDYGFLWELLCHWYFCSLENGGIDQITNLKTYFRCRVWLRCESTEIKRPRSLSSSCTHRIGRDGGTCLDTDKVWGDAQGQGCYKVVEASVVSREGQPQRRVLKNE